MQTLKKHKALLLCFMSLFFMAGMCEEDPYVDNVLVQSINLSHSYAELRVGERLTLTAAVAPQNATTKSLSWRSHDEGVAIVDATAADEAEVIAVSPGTAVITATTKDGSGVTATCVITVTDNNNSEDPDTQWSEWAEFATARNQLTVLWQGTLSDVQVYHRISLTDPTNQQFAFQNHPGYDMIIDYDATTNRCHVGVTDINYAHETHGAVYVADSEIYGEHVNPNFLSHEETQPSTFDPETGLFSLHLVYFVSEGYFGAGYEYLQLDGYAEPDYSINLDYLGCDENTASFYISKGADVSTYRYAIAAGALSQEEAYDMAWNIIDGAISFYESEESDYHDFYLTEAGEYTVVAVSFDETGTPKKYAWFSFDFSATSQDYPWESLGMATYREDIVTTFFNVENIVYEVEIERNVETPGLYRLVNPYGAAYPYNDEGDYDTSENHYMVIDAQDPEAVTIQQTYTGMNWGYGEFIVWSLADYYLNQGVTAEEIAAEGHFGKLENGVITFPTRTLIIAMTEYENSGLFYANQNGLFAVALPGYSIPEYNAPAAVPALRTTKQIDKKAVTPEGPSLKRHFTNTGVITNSIKRTDCDIIR